MTAECPLFSTYRRVSLGVHYTPYPPRPQAEMGLEREQPVCGLRYATGL
jgi:hypothetical protein